MSAHHGANSALRLPAVMAIGFTGHRQLQDESKCRAVLRDYLLAHKNAYTGILYAVSSAAAGGDQIFCETCLELDIPVRVLLPRPVAEFHTDFDAFSWQRTRRILEKAISVEVITASGGRNEQYYDCGIQTVAESQLLIALWDGEPSRGMGGTAEIVAFARKTGHPVAWIHPTSGAIELANHVAGAQVDDRRELEFLNRLPDKGAALESSQPRALAEAWLEKIDKNSTRFAPQARRLGSIPVVYTAAAAVLSGVAPEIPAAAPWLAVSAALGIVALFLPTALRLHARQALWARTRTAAEIARSVLALWSAPGLYNVVGSDVLPTFAGVLRSLNFLKMHDRPAQTDLAEFKQQYRHDRIADQMAYFARQAERAEHHERRYGAVSWICGVLATLIAAGYLASQAHWIEVRPLPHHWIALVMSALFEIATMAGAFALMKDSARRRRRYRELADCLRRWDAQFEALNTWASVLHIANRVERALLVELLEWRSVVLGASHHGK